MTLAGPMRAFMWTAHPPTPEQIMASWRPSYALDHFALAVLVVAVVMAWRKR